MGFGPYRYEAMTSETPAPEASGVVSPWTHLIEEDGHGTVLRFWLDDDAVCGTRRPVPVVYQRVADHITDAQARWLIDEMFFVVLTQHYYRPKIEMIAYRSLDAPDVTTSPYPNRQERKS